ncbi:MAG: TolC family protein [Desulfobulbaceae bacterium]|nr:TolC family protein [Desulfobulbaceae bacterium]
MRFTHNVEAKLKPYAYMILTFFFLLAIGEARGKEAGEPAVPDIAAIEVLDLHTAQALALAANPTVHAAMERVEQARARLRQAAAAWWPSLDLTGSGGRIRLSEFEWQRFGGLAELGGQGFERTYENYTAGIQASWIIFDGFFRTFREEQAEYGTKSEEAARRDVQRLLVAAVAEAYLNAQLAQTNVEIARADSEFYNQQLRDSENRYEVGAGTWGDILNIKVQLNSAKTNDLLASREYEAAGYGLAALLGLPDAELPEHIRLDELDAGVDLGGQEEDPEQLIRDALELRPDVAEMISRVKEAEARVGMARAPFYPTLQLVGAVDGIRQGDMGFTGDDFGDTILVNLTWNLYAGGADKAAKVEAEHTHREARYILADLRNLVASQVRQDITLLEAAREQVVLQQESVKLVEENRELAKNEYEAGEASLVRLNEAQRDLTTTYSRLAQARVAYHRAKQRLLASTGLNIDAFIEQEAALGQYR